MHRSPLCWLAALVVALGLSAPLAAQPATLTPTHRTCGTEDPTLQHQAELQAAVEAWRASNAGERGGRIVTVPVAWHIITRENGTGGVSQQEIDDQMAVLNDAYRDAGYQFVNAFQQTVANDDWADLTFGGADEIQMKSTLALDPAVYLNSYTAPVLRNSQGPGLLGWATFPDSGSEGDILQGQVLLASTLPGGANGAPYGLGDTATHEVGHYVGLFHTFQGGCSGFGDGVDDTPAVASPNFGCPQGRDSCPNDDLGPDQVENFMDYVDDSCMDTFTPGQIERATALMTQFRPTIQASPAAILNPTALAFGDVNANQTVTETVRFTSLRDVDIVVSEVSVSNDVFEVDLEPFTLAAGETATFAVSFSPLDNDTYTGTLSLVTDNDELGTVELELSGNGFVAPAAGLGPLGLQAAADVDGETTATLTLSNTGAGPLDYGVGGLGGTRPPSVMDPATDPLRLQSTAGVKGDDDRGLGTAPRLGAGGPDAFGYSWIDSNEPGGPVYDWVDISATGTALGLTDDQSAVIDLPFDFPFYGQTFGTVRVSSNGYIYTQGPLANESSGNPNPAIPNPAEPDGVIAGFWDDLNPENGGEIYAQDLGDGRYVVQWQDMALFTGPGTATFQIILDASGTIQVHYEAFSATTTSATIGLEAPSGTEGLQVVRNAAYVEEGLALLFTAAPTWLRAADPAVGTVAPNGGEQEVTLTFSGDGLEAGAYQHLLRIYTNDPEQAAIPVHTVLSVGGALAPPALIGPVWGSVNVPTDLALEWLPAAAATSYDVEVALDQTFDTVVFSETVTDNAVAAAAAVDTQYYWRVRSNDGNAVSDWSLPFVFSTGATVDADDRATTGGFALGAAFPNPTSGVVSVPFTLAEAGEVTIAVFDVTGREVATLASGVRSEGAHTVEWDAAAMPAGVYLVRLQAGSELASTRVVVSR